MMGTAKKATAPPSPAQEANTMQISDAIFNTALKAFDNKWGASKEEKLRAALESALSTDAEPVATVAEMGAGGMRVLIPHPPGSTQHLSIGTKLYADPVKTAPAVAVKATSRADLASAINAKIVEVNERKYGKNRAQWRMLTTGEIVDAVYALSAQVQDVAGWQPIETADKNASRLLLGMVRREVLEETHVGGYRWAVNEDDVSCWWSDQADDEIVPTHWMPLPASPASNRGGP